MLYSKIGAKRSHLCIVSILNVIVWANEYDDKLSCSFQKEINVKRDGSGKSRIFEKEVITKVQTLRRSTIRFGPRLSSHVPNRFCRWRMFDLENSNHDLETNVTSLFILIDLISYFKYLVSLSSNCSLCYYILE